MLALLHLKRRGALTFIGSFYFASSTVVYPHIKRESANDFDLSSPKIVLLNKVCALSENKKNVKKKKKLTRFDSHMISQSKIRLVEFVQCNKK